MTEIVNLNRARKAKARAEKERTAADNRARFGRSKIEKTLAEKQESLAEARHEGHRLTTREDEK